MILLNIKTPDGSANIVHVIEGDETRLYMELNGNVMMDLNTVLGQHLDLTKPTILNFSKCKSEKAVASKLRDAVENGMEYPFNPGALVIVNTSELASDKKKSKDKIIEGKCSWCGCNVELVPKVKPTICFNCLTINNGIAKKASENDPNRK